VNPLSIHLSNVLKQKQYFQLLNQKILQAMVKDAPENM
ncbi:uncharacterized protein METZ01_LOCUS188171, partial [marine metagenome]